MRGGDDTPNLLLSHMGVTPPLPDVGPTPMRAFTVARRGGKTDTTGGKSYLSCIQHHDPRMDPVGALALYVVTSFHFFMDIPKKIAVR